MQTNFATRTPLASANYSLLRRTPVAGPVRPAGAPSRRAGYRAPMTTRQRAALEVALRNMVMVDSEEEDYPCWRVFDEAGSVATWPFPELKDYPCWRVFEEPVLKEVGGKRIEHYGVWHFDLKDGKPLNTYVCGPLHVVARAHAASDKYPFGHVILRWETSTGLWQDDWAMPFEMLVRNAKNVRVVLLSAGLDINPDAHRLLTRFLAGGAA